jgi:dCTP deaminase
MPANESWQDWIPGILSKRQVEVLRNRGHISPSASLSTDKSSIDLTIADECYEMLLGSVKPFGPRYKTLVLENTRLATPIESTSGVFSLTRKKTYVFRIEEKFEGVEDAPFYGQATAKSSVGRMDVLARLIVDGMPYYEYFDPDGYRKGTRTMYLEVTPLTFNVRVKTGTSLSQLRLFHCDPKRSILDAHEIRGALLHGDGLRESDFSLSLELSPTEISSQNKASAFCASDQKDDDDYLDLWTSTGKAKPCPKTYWDPITCDSDERNIRTLEIKKDYFYILRSKERLSLPKGIAAYCRATDETIGEMRIHYAGFVHPLFGKERSDAKQGTPLIFEVRGHDVNVNLRDGEIMAQLIFYRMSEDCPPELDDSGYNNQTLKLSKYFDEWSD